MGYASCWSQFSHREGRICKRSRQLTRSLQGCLCEVHTCSYNSVGHRPLCSPTTKGAGGVKCSKSIHLHPEQEVICQAKANNVPNTYLRKSQRQIQDQGFIFCLFKFKPQKACGRIRNYFLRGIPQELENQRQN